MNKVPAIRALRLDDQYYCYDAYTNTVLNVSPQHYIELLELSKIGTQVFLGKNTEPLKIT